MSEPSVAELREQVERHELLLRKRTLETASTWFQDYVNPAEPLFDKSGLDHGAPGLVQIDGKSFAAFIAAAKKHRIWDRDELVNPPR